MSEGSREEQSGGGGCLCGAVRYRVYGPMRNVINCHCSQCLRTHGHIAAYARLQRASLELQEETGLRWYRSSPSVRRGFCQNCGASLFWEPADGQTISVAAGTLDPPTGLKTVAEIFVADASDYYRLDDRLPHFSTDGEGNL